MGGNEQDKKNLWPDNDISYYSRIFLFPPALGGLSYRQLRKPTGGNRLRSLCGRRTINNSHREKLFDGRLG